MTIHITISDTEHAVLRAASSQARLDIDAYARACFCVGLMVSPVANQIAQRHNVRSAGELIKLLDYNMPTGSRSPTATFLPSPSNMPVRTRNTSAANTRLFFRLGREVSIGIPPSHSWHHISHVLGIRGTHTARFLGLVAIGKLVYMLRRPSHPPASSLQPPASSLQPPASSLQPPASSLV